MKIKHIRYPLFVLISSLFIGLLSSSDFITTPTKTVKDIFILGSQWFIIFIHVVALVYLLSVNKFVYAVTFPLLSFFCAVLAYFRYTMNAVFSSMIFEAAIDNDTQVTTQLITWQLVCFVLICVLVSAFFVWYRFKKIKVSKGLLQAVIAIAVLGGLLCIQSFRRPVSERIPFNLYFIPKRYFDERTIINTQRPPISEGAEYTAPNDSLIVVFVLGESLRADHLAFNGYHRNTTPCLSKEDIVSLPNVYCIQTYTNSSLPYILTRADSLHPERGYEERSFIDLFNACGFYTAWLANQESANSYVYFMHECDTLKYLNADKSPYTFDKWVDGSMFPAYEALLRQPSPRKMIVLHTIGSHWYYNSHFTEDFQRFNPITNSRIISSNTTEEMINSYDNTVLYTDSFIHRLIEKIRSQNAILIYLSDHGESLGENGNWLHALDDTPVHYPAAFVWMSDTYKSKYPEKYEILNQNRFHYYNTDFLFHSILDAAHIETPVLEEGKSVFQLRK